MITNGGKITMVVAYLQLLSQKSPVATDEKHEHLSLLVNKPAKKRSGAM